MTHAEFDAHAATYDADLTAAVGDPAYFAESTVRDLARAYPARAGMRVLDLGAGVGRAVPFLRQAFPRARFTLADKSGESLALARARYPEDDVTVAPPLGVHLPFADGTFDVVFASGVFHHVPALWHFHLLCEMRRVLAPGGLAAVFEHNPRNPVTRAVVRRCAFDADAVLIPPRRVLSTFLAAEFRAPRLCYRRFIPPALRALRPLERLLGGCPRGAPVTVMAPR